MRRAWIAPVLASVVALAAVAGVEAGGERTAAGQDVVRRAGSGAVQAELRYRKNASGSESVHPSSERSGVKLVAPPITDLASGGAAILTFAVRDLDGGKPEVLVSAYTGGAYCCTVS